jgi:unsaturated chondroitin disaccharide hydrolase
METHQMNPTPPSVFRGIGALAGLALVCPAAATVLDDQLAAVWTLAEQRSEATVSWMNATYGVPLMHTRYPQVGNPATGKWTIATTTRDWRAGFWPGVLWMLSERTGNPVWKQRAVDWSNGLATSLNLDHDIGFITLGSFGKGYLANDDLTDPGGVYRLFAKQAILGAAAKLDARFNKAVIPGVPIPAGFTRSWNTPFEDPYPVCIDNLMNLEVMFLAYELNGRLPQDRPWFDHALIHARNTIVRHMRADGGTYHVVKHFESGPSIGMIERKSTVQGYGDETTWSRGQAWAIHGFTMAYRHAKRDPGTNATDLLGAAEAAADYFIARLPHYFTADSYNHRIGDFVPPSDFDAALGEPAGLWNDANNDYNSTTHTGLGDAKPAMAGFTPRDSSAAAIAASGLLELADLASTPAKRQTYLLAAQDILTCLITYDGPDPGTDPDYLCSVSESAHPGILKAGSVRWPGEQISLSYGDYYFLEALARYEARTARDLLARSQQIQRVGPGFVFSFEMTSPSPALALRVQWTSDPASVPWTNIAYKTGAGTWGGVTVSEQALPGNRVRASLAMPPSSGRGFVRILTRSIGG